MFRGEKSEGYKGGHVNGTFISSAYFTRAMTVG